MQKDIHIIKNIYKIEQKIKKCINQKKSIPKNVLAILDEANYSINNLSQIVKIYKATNE